MHISHDYMRQQYVVAYGISVYNTQIGRIRGLLDDKLVLRKTHLKHLYLFRQNDNLRIYVIQYGIKLTVSCLACFIGTCVEITICSLVIHRTQSCAYETKNGISGFKFAEGGLA